MKIQDVINVMEAHHTHFRNPERTCDGVIIGDTQRECTGVVLTCCPTAAVIQKAEELGYNFIICHEPTFFDGWDETEWQKDSTVYQRKKKLIEETGMTIYRNHDHLHSDVPDGIFSGVTRLLGWEKYAKNKELTFMPGCCFELPATTVGEIAKHLSEVLHIDGIRIIGNPDMEVTRAGFTFHFGGSPLDQKNIRFIEENDMQVIIPGEVVDWTIGEYVQDAITLGVRRALLNVGHFNWEEPGMEAMAEWMAEDLHHAVPVQFIQSGNQYQWYTR